MRLSYSSCTQTIEQRHSSHYHEGLQHTNSLELKRESLGAYAEDAGDSIILQRHLISREMKNVQSNYDLLMSGSQLSESEVRPTYSGILDKCESPVRRLKRKYGENMLSPYDKETIESRSFVSQ